VFKLELRHRYNFVGGGGVEDIENIKMMTKTWRFQGPYLVKFCSENFIFQTCK